MISGLRAACAVLVWLSLTTFPPYLNAEADMAVIEGTVICTCGCPNMVLNTCICGHADEMRAEIGVLIDDGNSEEEVIQILIQRYGERILAAPKAEGFNLAAYVTPFLALLLGGGLIIALIRRWKRNSSEVVEDRLPSQELERDDPYMQKLKEELDAFKD